MEISKDRLIPRSQPSLVQGGIDPSRVVPREEKQSQVNDQDRLEWGQVAKEAFKNIPSSAVETGRSFIEPFLHPIKTGKAVGRLGAGMYQKLTEGEQEYEKDADAFIGFMKERYGSVENFKKTMAKDPVGVSADIASLFTGGGALVKGIGTAGKMGRVAKVGGMISKTGAIVDPFTIGKAVVTSPFRAIPTRMTEKLYGSALKLSTTLTPDQRAKIIETGLSHEAVPTYKSLLGLSDKIEELNNQVKSKIDAATTSGARTVPLSDLIAGFDDLKQQFILSGTPDKSIKAIERIEAEIQTIGQKLGGRSDITIQEAQRLKQTIYKELKTAYATTRFSPASTQAQKLIAYNAKTAIEQIIPEIKSLNAKEGALIELEHALEKAAARVTNNDIFGLHTYGGALAGGALGKGGAMAGGVGLGILDRPVVKAKIAIALNKLSKQGVAISPNATLTKMGIVQSGRNWRVIQEERD